MDNIIDELGLEDVVTFGKYKDYTVEEILDEDPEYLLFLDGQTDCKICQSVLDLIES